MVRDCVVILLLVWKLLNKRCLCLSRVSHTKHTFPTLCEPAAVSQVANLQLELKQQAVHSLFTVRGPLLTETVNEPTRAYTSCGQNTYTRCTHWWLCTRGLRGTGWLIMWLWASGSVLGGSVWASTPLTYPYSPLMQEGEAYTK